MKISVIIPCFNVEKYIEKAILSLDEQTHDDLEIICVNDGSTDNTLEILTRLKETSKRPFKLINQENAGASAARNTGLEHASGAYIQFLDGDDYLLADKIKNQIELAEKNGFPEIVAGGCKAYDEAGNFLFDRKFDRNAAYNVWLMLLKTNLGNTCANLFKSDYFKDGGSWDEFMKSSQDTNLMFGILKSGGKVVFDDEENTVLIRRTSDSISHQNFKDNWVRIIELRMKMLSYITENKLDVPLDEIHQIIFDAIRIFYKHDRKLAIDYYQKIIPKGFVPKQTETTGSSYIRMFKLLGFKLTERLRSLFRRVRHQEVTYG